MAVRIEMVAWTLTGLDWSDKYPIIIAALANVKAKAALYPRARCSVRSRIN
jgi:hypothetical protein